MKKDMCLVRREVLVPERLAFPDTEPSPCKHHGTITKVEWEQGAQIVHIKLTDFRKVKLRLNYEDVRDHVLPKRQKSPTLRWSPYQEHRAIKNVDKEEQVKPKKKKEIKVPEGVPVHGPAVNAYIQRLGQTTSTVFPPGTRLWAKTSHQTRWPGVAWSISLCKKGDVGDLVLSYTPNCILVKFYGQHSIMWVKETNCMLPMSPEEEEDFCTRPLRSWARQHNAMNLIKLALSEMSTALSDPLLEIDRMTSLWNDYLGRQMSSMRVSATNCYLCRDDGAKLQCGVCDRHFHSLCLRNPAVTEDYLPHKRWECPCCFEVQSLEVEIFDPKSENENEECTPDGEPVEVERMGLTPDWLISAAAFRVFKLEKPTAGRPYIKGLLDPCTNSKFAPNIPAEVLYDKIDDGLKLKNSWAGYYILLNPDYKAQIQWRFVNRAIDEVENGSVKGIVLVIRNSTDTNYFQRLRPYPRVMLRRTTAQFKDYNNSPPGFGIAVFCVAQHHKRELFLDFITAFSSFGEPSIPIDAQLLQCDSFYLQLERSKKYAEQHYRDHWVQCSVKSCKKWRIIDHVAASSLDKDLNWTCAMLRPPNTNCETPLTRSEIIGGHYTPRKDGFLKEDHCVEQEYLEEREEEQEEGEAHAVAIQSIPEQSIVQSVQELPLMSIRSAICAEEDAEIITALELSRLARMAANRAFLQHIAQNTTAKSYSSDVLPTNHDSVLVAARELARIAAIETSVTQKEAAWNCYQQARRKRMQDEAPLLAALEKVRHDEEHARRKWEHAQEVHSEVLKHL